MAVDLATFSPKRILVCQLRQIGDVVLATPSIELLKRRYPDAEIHLLTEKKCAPLLEHNPHLGKVWALDKKVLSSLPQEIAWYWHVARTGYDLVVDFQQLPRCRWVVAFSGAPVRLSYTPPWYTRLLYTHSSDMLDGYSAMSKASVLRPLGIEWNARLSHGRGARLCAHLARSGRLAAGTAPHHAGPHAPPAHAPLASGALRRAGQPAC